MRTVSTEVTSPLGEDDPHQGHLPPWARTTRTEVTSPMGEDDPHRGHLAHGRGPTSCPETVHPRLNSCNTILGPLDAIPILDEASIVSEDRLNRGHLAPG
ncbi:hypothetical protein HID58_056786 [Brassica napus]|uniref:Uncharacterized protein n=1 Tax=Brassica napus TaxID=3708 RepID=A0ABQ8APA1_BRANA|nr:hypothetical protein HID58_056786 [Brassica napus]